MKKYVITSSTPFCKQETLLATDDKEATRQYLKMYACKRKTVEIVSKIDF